MNWMRSKTWEGIAGKFTPKGTFSPGGPKETAHAVCGPASEGYARVRGSQPDLITGTRDCRGGLSRSRRNRRDIVMARASAAGISLGEQDASVAKDMFQRGDRQSDIGSFFRTGRRPAIHRPELLTALRR